MVKTSNMYAAKVELKKGPWTPEEDKKLSSYIQEHGSHGSWKVLSAKAGLQRCGKSCRLRWNNYLRPDIKRGKFSLQEEQTIIQLHALLGNRWSVIATYLPKRTDNEIKNYWNSHLKKKLQNMGFDPVTHKPKVDAFGYSNSYSNKNTAILRHTAQWESTRLQAEARLVRESKQLIMASNINNPTNNDRPKFLDVLKAWQEIVSGMISVTGDSLECCPSTSNFTGNNNNKNGSYQDWECTKERMDSSSVSPYWSGGDNNGWFVDSFYDFGWNLKDNSDCWNNCLFNLVSPSDF